MLMEKNVEGNNKTGVVEVHRVGRDHQSEQTGSNGRTWNTNESGTRTAGRRPWVMNVRLREPPPRMKQSLVFDDTDDSP